MSPDQAGDESRRSQQRHPSMTSAGVRWPPEDLVLVTIAARSLGLTRAAFVRQCVMAAVLG